MSADVLDRPVVDQGSVPSPEDIEAALLALGNTADEVAAGLHTQGITGKRRAAWSCPLANYLNRQFPASARTVVFASTSLFFVGYGDVFIDTPDAAFDFLQAFDEGDFPALEES